MCNKLVSLLLLSSCLISVQAFVVPQQKQHALPAAAASTLSMAKGFGDAPKKQTPKKKTTSNSPAPTQVVAEEKPIYTATEDESNPFPEREISDASLGKQALERMRRERAEKRNEELRRVKEVQDTDALLREQPSAAVIPERVAQRMGKRMLPFVGIPLLGGMGAFVGFWYMATYRDMEFQPALVAATTIGMLAIGLVGITYSVMSASWDEDREGTVLGTDEFSRNVENIKSGLTRSRDNARLRETMNEYSAEDFANLEKSEAAKEKRRQSFNEKFGNDLD